MPLVNTPVPGKGRFLAKWAIMGSLVCLVLIVIAAFVTTVPSIVEFLQSLTIPFCLLLAGSLGFLGAGSTNDFYTGKSSKFNPSTVVIAIGAAIFVYFVPNIAEGGEIITLAISAVLVGFGVIMKIMEKNKSTTLIKPIAIIVVFVAGLVPGVILFFFLNIILSNRYCKLTSSKCM